MNNESDSLSGDMKKFDDCTDNSNQNVNKLYANARMFLEYEDYSKAYHYYTQLTDKFPSDWEAYFFEKYCDAILHKEHSLREGALSLTKCMKTVAILINKHLPADQQEKALNKIYVHINKLIDDFIQFVEQRYNNNIMDVFVETENKKSKYFADLQEQLTDLEYINDIIYDFGNAVDDVFGSKFSSIAVQAWKDGANFLTTKIINKTYYAAPYKKIMGEYTQKIKKHESYYIEPKSSSKTGCYIATSVYGSYDCPEVWTLRRFRDYSLDNNVLGRAFIKGYYAISPTLVEWFGETSLFNSIFRTPLNKFVDYLNHNGYDNTPYSDKKH